MKDDPDRLAIATFMVVRAATLAAPGHEIKNSRRITKVGFFDYFTANSLWIGTAVPREGQGKVYVHNHPASVN